MTPLTFILNSVRHVAAFKVRTKLGITPPIISQEDQSRVRDAVAGLERDGVATLRGLIAPELIYALHREACFNETLLKHKEEKRFRTVKDPLLNCRSSLPIADGMMIGEERVQIF